MIFKYPWYPNYPDIRKKWYPLIPSHYPLMTYLNAIVVKQGNSLKILQDYYSLVIGNLINVIPLLVGITPETSKYSGLELLWLFILRGHSYIT